MLTASDASELSLRNILAQCKLVGATPAGDILTMDAAQLKAKSILFYLLVKGFWQFFNSEFMASGWTKDSIQFLREYRDHKGALTAGVFLDRPLFSTELLLDQKQQEQESPHQDLPQIRDLGIMLLEILLGREIESFRGLPEFAAYLPGGEPTPYTDYRIAAWLFEKRVRTDDLIPQPLLAVIAMCLDPVLSSDLLSHSEPNHSGSNRLREAIHKRLVLPLELLVCHSYCTRNGLFPLHELSTAAAGACPGVMRRPGTSDQGAPSPGIPRAVLPVTEPRKLNDTMYVPSSCCLSSRLDLEVPDSQIRPRTGAPSQRWLDDVDVVSGLLLAGKAPRKVKVAVIDTGFSPKWGNLPWDIQKGNYRDFVDGMDDDNRDDSGHGTYLARLVVKILPKVDLHIARVQRHGILTEETFGAVEKAIDWAVGKQVDIILIASGGTNDYDNVKSAISRLPDNILVIAAAGNLPLCSRVVFPARMRNVMCIFAATATNKNARALNPPPLKRGYNFAFLGEAVQPQGHWGDPESGTSVAAPIAAGFAGMLLDFSRQALPEGEDDRLDLGRHLHEKMSTIFEELSRNNRDEGYECVSPPHLLDILKEESTRRERRRKIRNFLSDVIALHRY